MKVHPDFAGYFSYHFSTLLCRFLHAFTAVIFPFADKAFEELFNISSLIIYYNFIKMKNNHNNNSSLQNITLPLPKTLTINSTIDGVRFDENGNAILVVSLDDLVEFSTLEHETIYLLINNPTEFSSVFNPSFAIFIYTLIGERYIFYFYTFRTLSSSEEGDIMICRLFNCIGDDELNNILVNGIGVRSYRRGKSLGKAEPMLRYRRRRLLI